MKNEQQLNNMLSARKTNENGKGTCVKRREKRKMKMTTTTTVTTIWAMHSTQKSLAQFQASTITHRSTGRCVKRAHVPV